MIETKNYDLRLVNFIEHLVDNIPVNEMSKYSEAINLKLSDYDDIEYLLKDIKKSGTYSSLIDVVEKISSALSDEENSKEPLKVILEKSIYKVNSIVKIKNGIQRIDVLNIIESTINSFSFSNKMFEYFIKPIIVNLTFREELYKSEFKKSKNTNSMISFIMKYTRERLSKKENYYFDDLMKDSDNINNLIELVNNILNSLMEVGYIELSWTPGINETIVNNEIHEYYSEKFIGNSSQSGYENGYYIYRNGLKNELINSIIYRSASDECRLYKYDKQSLYVQNGVFIPKYVFEKIVELLPYNISNAMSNYYMFLSGDEVSFSDREGKKYSFSIDNIHILGLKNDIDVLIDYFEKIVVTEKLDSVINLEQVECPSDTGLFDGNIDSLLRSLSYENSSLEEQIKCLNNAQGIVTEYMTVDSIEQKIELLVYYYSLNNDVVSVNNGLKEKILNLEITKLDSILMSNSYCFGQKFIKDFKTNKRNEYFNNFCLIYNDESKRREIINKYNSLFKVQKYLDYKHKVIAKEIVGSLKNVAITKEQVKSYFLDNVYNNSFNYKSDNSFTDSLNNTYTIKYVDDYNYEIFDGSVKMCRVTLNDITLEIDKILEVNSDYKIESNSKRRLRIRKNNEYNEILSINFGVDEITVNKKNKNMNIFSLADIYMRANYKQIKDELEFDLSSVLTLINIFKLYDKCLYLNNFNFSVDISNIFVTDLQRNAEIGIICEMSALNDALYALFDYMDKDGSTHFVSIQDAESLMLLSSVVSLFPTLINFQENEYKSIFGFCEKERGKYKNVLTQTHSDFRKKEFASEKFISKLKDRSIIFRYATSGIVDRTYDSLDPVTNINDMNLLDLINKNLYGCSNAMLWLESVDLEQFLKFTGITNMSLYYDNISFYEIKTLLYRNIMDNISDLINRIDIELEHQEMLLELKKYKNGNEEKLSVLKNYLRKSGISGFDESKLNVRKYTKDEIVRYIQNIFDDKFNIYLLPSQVSVCKDIRKELLNFTNDYSYKLLDSIIDMNYFDVTTFDFIKNMNDYELNQFIEDIILRYPSYLVEMMKLKYEFIQKEMKLDSNNSLVMNTINDRRFMDLSSPYSKDKINLLVGSKDEDRKLLLYLEDKISAYKKYINITSKNRIVTVSTMFKVHSELVAFIEQYIILLSKKTEEAEFKINEKGFRAGFKKMIDDPSIRKERIEKDKKNLENELKKYSNKLNLYRLINKILESDARQITLEDINMLFSLGKEYTNLPACIIKTLKDRISGLIETNELDSKVVYSLKSLNLRIDSENNIKELLDRIKNTLLNKKNLINYTVNKSPESSFLYFGEQRRILNERLQQEVDVSNIDIISRLYQNISIVFSEYPDYRDRYLADVESRIKELYEEKSEFEYKSYFELILQKNKKSLELDILKSHMGYRAKINESLENMNTPEEMFELLNTKFKEEFTELCDSYSLYRLKIDEILKVSVYQCSEEEQEMIDSSLKSVISNVNVVDTYIDCLINSLNKRLEKLNKNCNEFITYSDKRVLPTLYDLDSGKMRNLEGAATDLVCIYLVGFYKFLSENIESINYLTDSDAIEKYKIKITDKCINLLNDKLIPTNELVQLINNNSRGDLISGRRH